MNPKYVRSLETVKRIYALYEEAVQSPEVHVEFLERMGREVLGKEPLRLREDFCGTFRISHAWIKSDSLRTAQAVDLDPLPLVVGLETHGAYLDLSEWKRLEVRQGDVLKVRTVPGADVILAPNFSFMIFHERAQLLSYARRAFQSLAKKGAFVLEMAGGAGFTEKVKESRKFRRGRAKYTWEQKGINPINLRAKYSIHLQEGREKFLDAFTYDWRIWSMPEVRDILLESGFRDVLVYWEQEKRGRGTGVYRVRKNAPDDHTWIVYLVGVK
jgi:hypothetical protein